MLDLRFLWDNSSPCLIACSGGLRYILLEASIMHHLPVITQKEMHVLIEAIHCFTETGELWNAQIWSKKLGKKLGPLPLVRTYYGFAQGSLYFR